MYLYLWGFSVEKVTWKYAAKDRWIPKKILLSLFFLVFFSFSNLATVYYVSADGDDENDGTSENTPWRSLSKVNSFTPTAGDQILFRRGDIWEGSVTVNGSGSKGNPIIYGAYGTGVKPIIYGSEEITGWTNYSENIFKASVTRNVSQVFIDGLRVRTARYPDSGYFYINSVSGTTQFTSAILDSEIDYTGARWYGRTRYWFGVLRHVTASTSKTLTLASEPNGGMVPNIGFFLMNKLEFLTQAGEWYYDTRENTLYLWTPNGDSPENYKVTASVHSNGVTLNNRLYVIIKDLDLREQNENGVLISGGASTGVEINNLDISYPDKYGISASGGGAHLIKGNNITHANGGGLLMWVKDSHVTENIISYTAVFEELGINGTTAPNGGSGAEISGENNMIEYNTIENSNYNGLFFRGAGSIIQYNFINNSCLYKDDGGAIYTNTSGTGGTVRYNIVLNSIGNPEGYISTRSMAEGIYIDEIAQNVLVEHNTIQNTGDAAIKLHNVGGIKVENNTIMTARYGIWCNKYVGSPSPITNNIVYMTTSKDDYEPRSLFSRVGSYNTQFDYNKYYNPTVSELTQVFRESTYFTFAQWKAATKQDANSTFNSTPLATEESVDLLYNASKIAKKYSLNGAVVKDVDGKTMESGFKLEPYASIILIGNNLDKISVVPDTIPPDITSFSIPSTYASLTVPVSTFTATDDIGVTGYLLTGTTAAPVSTDSGWTTEVPATSTFSEPGFYTIYAWAKDAAGNISGSQSATVTINLMDLSPIYLEYLFEESSGATVIDTQGPHNGTIINEEIRVEGVKGNGLEFTGAGYISLGQVFGNRVDDEVSLSAWIKPALISEGYQGIIMHGGADSSSFALLINPDKKSIDFKTSGTASPWINIEVIELRDGNWHHIVATYSGTEKTIYLDNVPLKSIAANGPITSGHGYNMYIGAGNEDESPGLLYKGLIDEVRIYNYALSVSDVSDLYHEVIDTTTYINNYRNNSFLRVYPNPFNRHVNIEVAGTGKNVRIDVFNITGTLIKNIYNGHVTNNLHSVIWDGRDEKGGEVSAGIYFVRFVSGNTTEINKISKY